MEKEKDSARDETSNVSWIVMDLWVDVLYNMVCFFMIIFWPGFSLLEGIESLRFANGDFLLENKVNTDIGEGALSRSVYVTQSPCPSRLP